MSSVSPASSSTASQPSHTGKGSDVVLKSEGYDYFSARYDDSFKYIYTRDNGKYGLAFAQDIAKIIGYKPLADREVESFQYRDEQLGEAWASATVSGKSDGNSSVNKGKRVPDVVLVFRDIFELSKAERADKNRNYDRDICIHFEMQNGGTRPEIAKRGRNYDNVQFRDDVNGTVAKSPEQLLGINVLHGAADKTAGGCPVEVVGTETVSIADDKGKGHKRMEVILYVRRYNEKGAVKGTVDAINEKWDTKKIFWHGKVNGKKKVDDREGAVKKIIDVIKDTIKRIIDVINEKWNDGKKEVNDAQDGGPWDRVKQRVIALSLLGKKGFTLGDFEKYITSKPVKEEFECMKRTSANLDRPDIKAQLVAYDDVFEEGYDEGYDAGKIEGCVSTLIEYVSGEDLKEKLVKVAKDASSAEIVRKALKDRLAANNVPGDKKGAVERACKEIEKTLQSTTSSSDSSQASKNKNRKINR